MEYVDLPNGTEFIENGRRYIVTKNWSYFLTVMVPCSCDFVLVFRPDDSGLTFRGGTMPKDNIILKSKKETLTEDEICSLYASL